MNIRYNSKRSSTRLSLGIAAVSLTFPLVLTACSSGSGQSGNDDAADYPLADLYNALYDTTGYESSSEEEMNAQFQAQQTKVEEAVAQCMADEGFDYIPFVGNYGVSIVASSDESDDPAEQYGTVEYAQKYGYGMYTGEDENVSSEDEEQVENPNDAIVNQMSDSERESYYIALYGDSSDITEEEAETYEYDWTKVGCSGKAQHETDLDNSASPYTTLSEDPQWAELISEADDLWEKAEQDSEMTSLISEWANCMADSGISGVKSPDGVYDLISEKMDELYQPSSSDSGTDNYDEIKPELAAYEISIAVPDATCKKKLDYDNKNNEIYNRIQQEFVDANKDKIEALIVAAQQIKNQG